MSGRRDSAQRALNTAVPFLAPEHHHQILAALSAEGLLDEPRNAENGGRLRAADADTPRKSLLMTPLQASAARKENVELVRQCRATCARHGYVMKENELIDVHALNNALSTADISSRMRLKSQLFSLHLIPA
jgi:hypothetical protein